MRVAVKATSLGGDGIGYYTRTLAEGLGALQSDLEFVLLTDCTELISASEAWPKFEAVRVESPSAWWEQFVLPEWLDENRIDLYHNPSFSLPLVKPCRYLTTVHDCIPVLFPEMVGPAFTRYFSTWAPHWFKIADHLLCNSHHTAHDLVHLYGVSPDDTSVVYHTGNACMKAVREPDAISQVKAKFGIDRPFILMVGRVELRKNVKGMLEAFSLLSQMDVEPHLLVFAGSRVPDAHDPDGLLPNIGRRGDIIVTGHTSEAEMAALYSSASVYCFPTFYEGFGRPLLEAMQCNAPIVTSRTSSLPEVGGDACLYVSPYHPREIATALYRVLTDDALRSVLIARGAERAKQFTTERMARETLAVYERVLHGISDGTEAAGARVPTASSGKGGSTDGDCT